VVEALVKNGFLAEYLTDGAAARARVLELIPAGAAVGFAGSMTVKSLELKEDLRRRDCVIYDHADAKTPAEALEIRRREVFSDVLLTSSNAITRDGRLYNVDGAGNRVAAMIFGPGEVIVVAGINKITADLAAAEERVRACAGPINNLRLNTGNPCVKTGKCLDCASPKRICNAAVIHHKCPIGAKIRVLLIGESLGY
jgi:hypothetical protein